VPPARSGSGFRSVGSDAGFTLIEVLMSALLVILIASAAAGALITTSHFSGDQRFRSQADSLATQDQERLRGLPDQQLGGLNQTRTVALSGSTFTVKSVSTYVDTTGASSCTTNAAAYYKIASTVSWSESFTSQPATLTEESLLSRPVTGDLRTQVTDQTLAPLAGVTVAASGAAPIPAPPAPQPSPQSDRTDANGCVLFAGMTPGFYNVALTPGTNYVDPNGNPAPTGTATVTTTSTVSTGGNPFHFGLAGSIVGTFTTSTTGAAGEADGISWLGSGGNGIASGPSQSAPLADPATPSTALTTGLMFPFLTAAPSTYFHNYTVYGGRCSGQLPPATTTNLFSVAPGSLNASQNIPEPFLYLASVTFKSGSSTNVVKPSHVKLTYNDGTCQDSWAATVTPSSTLPANGFGWLANPGQPYAPSNRLTVCADFLSGSTYYNASVTTSNTSFTGSNTVPTIPIVKPSFGSTGVGQC
jgi:Tfp pilus assembly protein PilV